MAKPLSLGKSFRFSQLNPYMSAKLIFFLFQFSPLAKLFYFVIKPPPFGKTNIFSCLNFYMLTNLISFLTKFLPFSKTFLPFNFTSTFWQYQYLFLAKLLHFNKTFSTFQPNHCFLQYCSHIKNPKDIMEGDDYDQ